MRGVGRKAVVEGGYTCKFGDGGGMGCEEVGEGRFNAARVLGWVAPSATVDIAV